MRAIGPAREVRARLPARRRSAPRAGAGTAARGFTLLELLVAIGILSLLSLLLYQAFDGLQLTKDGITRLADR
jgi:prepilin-type N-terminal cleavage/methylation domain-containing protein